MRVTIEMSLSDFKSFVGESYGYPSIGSVGAVLTLKHGNLEKTFTIFKIEQ